MRILTVRQPWAWAIIHGAKDVENRVRNIAGAYRGPVAIHAAKTFRRQYYQEITGQFPPGALRPPILTPTTIDRTHGAIIGVVDLTSVHHSTDPMNCVDREHGHNDQGEYLPCSKWAMDDHYHFMLANPRPLTTPIPYKGALGLRGLDESTTARINRQLSNT